MSTPTKAVSLLVGVNTRAVESESLKVGKSLKIGKIGFDFLVRLFGKNSSIKTDPQDFAQTFQLNLVIMDRH